MNTILSIVNSINPVPVKHAETVMNMGVIMTIASSIALVILITIRMYKA